MTLGSQAHSFYASILSDIIQILERTDFEDTFSQERKFTNEIFHLFLQGSNENKLRANALLNLSPSQTKILLSNKNDRSLKSISNV